jgi:parvulin-like peptidyl-prolyl isomerase
MVKRWVWVSCLLVLSCGQGAKPAGQEEGRPLAKVAGKAIGEAEFMAFVDKQPEWATLHPRGSAQVREYLQTLVDRALLLREAQTQGLAQEPEVVKALEWAFTQKLALEVDKKEVRPQVEVSDAEVEQRFREHHWDRQLKVAHIFTRTRERGEEALAALRGGESFASVAERLSEDPPSAGRGGEMPYYYGRLNATRVVRDALFALGVGQVSGLVSIPKGYEIFKVLDERKVEFDKIKDKVRQELVQERLAVQGQARFAEWAKEFGLEPDPQGLGVLVGVLRQGPQEGKFYLSPADLGRPLFRDQSGTLTLGEVIAQSGTIRQGRGLDDSLRVVEVLHSEVLAPRILAQRARQLKLDAQPELVAWRQRKEEELLITTLRQQVTARAVAPGEAEARQYYEAHLEKYRNPESTEVVEVLMPTAEEAKALLARFGEERRRLGPLVKVLGEAARSLPDRGAAGRVLQTLPGLPAQAGEPEALEWLRLKAAQALGKGQLLDDLSRAASPQDLAEEYLFRYLAIEYSQRDESRPVEGCYHLYWYEEARFGALVEQAMQAPIGAVLGPVPVDSLFSIAKVVGRQGSRLRPFEEVARQLLARLREEHQDQVFARWLEELRLARRGEVEYLDENIEALARELPAAKDKG